MLRLKGTERQFQLESLDLSQFVVFVMDCSCELSEASYTVKFLISDHTSAGDRWQVLHITCKIQKDVCRLQLHHDQSQWLTRSTIEKEELLKAPLAVMFLWAVNNCQWKPCRMVVPSLLKPAVALVLSATEKPSLGRHNFPPLPALIKAFVKWGPFITPASAAICQHLL